MCSVQCTLVLVFSDTSSLTSIAPPCDDLCLILALKRGTFKFSLEMCIEFMSWT